MKRLSAVLGALSLVIVVWAGPALAEDIKVDFDGKKGVAVPVLQQIRDGNGPAPVTHPKARPVMLRTERDCVTVSFSPDEPPVSDRIRLYSREYREVCHTGPNGQHYCHEELAWTYSASVRVQVTDRGPMLPWERDVFWVCLDGRWLEGDVIDASHQYSLKWQGTSYDATLLAKAGAKTRSLPDPNGITAAAPAYDGVAKNFILELADRWGEYYNGDQTVLTVQLKRNRPNWFDDLIVEKEISLPAAKTYAVRFADYAAEFSQSLKPGVEYYVNWRFKRVGSVSKDKWMKYRETGKSAFGQPAVSGIRGPQDPVVMGVKVCWLNGVDKNDCVYKCSDKTEHRQPVATPDPAHPDQPVLACPQLVFPF
ncbi:MAG: hypothetical protein HY748_17115 [Elusimicrobia bacterium]|nr:hypothetical protein [Elusimicrobiota bacterium]